MRFILSLAVLMFSFQVSACSGVRIFMKDAYQKHDNVYAGYVVAKHLVDYEKYISKQEGVFPDNPSGWSHDDYRITVLVKETIKGKSQKTVSLVVNSCAANISLRDGIIVFQSLGKSSTAHLSKEHYNQLILAKKR